MTSFDLLPQLGYIHHSFCREHAMNLWHLSPPSDTSKELVAVAASAWKKAPLGSVPSSFSAGETDDRMVVVSPAIRSEPRSEMAGRLAAETMIWTRNTDRPIRGHAGMGRCAEDTNLLSYLAPRNSLAPC